jgi:nucleoside-diphosphate-sugar epimerase
LKELVFKLKEVSGLQAVVDEENPLPVPIPHRYVSDLSRVRQELDWDPKIGLDKGLKDLFSFSG